MRQKDLAVLALVGITAAIISFFVAGAIFSPKKYSTKVPTVQKISSQFPDVKNDPTYNSFLNPQALDLTVPVQIGNSQNSAPFSGGQ
ncbi:hypothetical protein A3E49_03240 [Candidatus Saccharibacteria bacterium RIFCSPHIGHO2_12_FULL_49_19]|nr:MAG: hypothetical protein A2708_01540 [Candidatus Saccharibacteria bacterium RIFCSPHIGHO2_01_FULL_49_21]OGL36931.1 MAG: hypothetical protein A3E49_03240 [Candidatus Saccharibacteria bacterium RIFCSPHIGHO2_12_FULL_49_19]OGL37745.1 MAG: hypothetical protein A3B63_00120 [Candidatus Saccharibacteria bacterium RIFCSPLOWO2_01_FULL_49_22]